MKIRVSVGALCGLTPGVHEVGQLTPQMTMDKSLGRLVVLKDGPVIAAVKAPTLEAKPVVAPAPVVEQPVVEKIVAEPADDSSADVTSSSEEDPAQVNEETSGEGKKRRKKRGN